MNLSPDFERKLLEEIHALRLSFAKLETRFDNFLEVREEVDALKKKIQELEVSQAVSTSKLATIGAIAGIAISVLTNLFFRLIKE